MKDKRFDGIMIPLDNVSPDVLKIICLVADKEYSEALDWVDTYISQAEDVDTKNIGGMVSLIILALAGHKDIASILLEALLEKFKTHSRARSLCQRTLKTL